MVQSFQEDFADYNHMVSVGGKRGSSYIALDRRKTLFRY
jgi:hypothetical protein